jgi:hypothetical protein
MVDDSHDQEAERRLGTEEAEAFDRQLRVRENGERDQLLRRAGGAPGSVRAGAGRNGSGTPATAPSPATTADGADGAPPETPEDTGLAGVSLGEAYEAYDLFERPSLETLRLRREVERLTIYYNAVQNSRAWRMAQQLRRLMGRQAW